MSFVESPDSAVAGLARSDWTGIVQALKNEFHTHTNTFSVTACVMKWSSIHLSLFERLIVKPEAWFKPLLCEIRFVPGIWRKIILTLCTFVHFLWFLQPSYHLALAITVGSRQAAVAAVIGDHRLPRQAAGLGLLYSDMRIDTELHIVSLNLFSSNFAVTCVTHESQIIDVSYSK